ncbi:MAG: DUF1214 domain-containing protein [Actinomycetota bacterium]|nr:DUF1214 domain-containing protein [Actinomycetota bacterium]
MRRLALTVALAFAASAAIPASGASSAATRSPLPGCSFGTDVPGLRGYLAGAVGSAADIYARGLTADSEQERAQARRAFAAAAAAYVYGLPQVSVRGTVKHFPRNEAVSINALADPSVRTVVSPNVDTAYTVSWLDLVNGPLVVNVPDTGRRYYTLQFLDASSNAFAYVGSGSTGTAAGAYAIVPPGFSGPLGPGVMRIDAPSTTVWLLGRTLVRDAADLPAERAVQSQYDVTPLTAWTLGVRQPPVVLDRYPPTVPRSVPSGAQFIATLNQEMIIDPPPAADDCALSAMGPAGVAVPHPSPADTLAADLTDQLPPAPRVASDPVSGPAIDAGVAAGTQIVAAGSSRLVARSAHANHGWSVLGPWVGRYGTRYLARAIVARDLLAANTPQQSIYPIATTDAGGRPLSGDHRYTIRFARRLLPPVNAFWSVTLYDAQDFLVTNPIGRYAIGDRTPGLRRGRDGSLTLNVQHDAPAVGAQRANWLPAPTGPFHLVMRLYEPKAAALHGRWKPPSIVRVRTLRRRPGG